MLAGGRDLRFPPPGANFQIGAIHTTPVVVNGCTYFGTVNNSTFYKLGPDAGCTGPID